MLVIRKKIQQRQQPHKKQEDFADIQKIVKDRQQRRPGLMYQPPKFTRGAPTATPSAQQRMMQVVGRMLEELQKNIELPTEESTDA